MADTIDDPKEGWSAAIRYIAGRKTAEEALGFLSHITNILASVDPPDAVGEKLVAACVPFLGSGISVDITGVADPVQRSMGLHSALNELHPDRQLAPELPAPQQRVVSKHPRITELSTDSGLPSQLGNNGSVAVLALNVRGQHSGHLTIARHEQHRKGPISPADMALFGEVAALIAFANVVTQLTPHTRMVH